MISAAIKDKLFLVFRILLIAVLIGKILNWFLKFNDQVNLLLDITMYCLIGVAYLVMSFAWKSIPIKIIITTCGVFLLFMNLIPKTTTVDILGIVSIIVPMLIARFHKETKEVLGQQSIM